MATSINFPTYGFVDNVFAFTEENWRKYFRPVVFDSVQNGLAVSAGSGMTVNVAAGECRCGAVMGITEDAVTLYLDGGHSTYSRIDSIAVQYSYGEPSTLSIVVVKGTPAANPIPPVLSKNFGSLWQMELAQIEVPANASTASELTITDKRVIQNSLNEEIEAINAEIDSITSDIGAIDGEILSITTSIDGINGEIVSITTDIADINGKIDSITTDIDSINGEIDSITTSISGLESEVVSITGSIANIESEILSITTDIDSLSTSKQDLLTFDSTPTAESDNPVTSAGIKSALDNLLDTILGLVADNVETSTTTSKAYSAGDFLVKNNVLYKVSVDIASGGTITVGTNVVATNLTEQLKKSRFLTRY